jgi:hypothetical protein
VYAPSFGEVFSPGLLTVRTTTAYNAIQKSCSVHNNMRSPRSRAMPPRSGILTVTVHDRLLDGHRGGETPGLIPNPEAKPSRVDVGTGVREPPGRRPSCPATSLSFPRRFMAGVPTCLSGSAAPSGGRRGPTF